MTLAIPAPATDALLDQRRAPYVTALKELAARDWQRFHVPAHQDAAPGLAALFGDDLLAMDFPMSVLDLDRTTWVARTPGTATPLDEAQALAADAWGARRTWFLTNGASGGNHIATTVARALGETIIVQRSVHSSVIDGIARSGIDARFVQPTIDAGLSAALGVTAEDVAAALHQHPEAAAVYIVSPSYFGTVADVRAIADLTHAHGVPLIVDEAWGSHFGMDPALPQNALRLGADLVVSSTHKGAGSLTQSAMIHLGHGPFADRLDPLVDRVVRSYQSTSCSPILLASLDEARRGLMVDGPRLISRAIASAEAIRAGVRASGRFRDATPTLTDSRGTVAVDPLKVTIDVREAGITGSEAMHVLIAEHGVSVEMATPATLLLLIGATSPADPARFLAALEALPVLRDSSVSALPLPATGQRALDVHAAFFAETEIVSAAEAAGRISADSLAAYPPGIPNVVPGEVLSPAIIEYVRAMAAAPSGYVRGAHDPLLDTFRVVAQITRPEASARAL